MKEFMPKWFHRFDVDDEDEYLVFVVRYDKDINKYGGAINSCVGFVNEKDAMKACRFMEEMLKLTQYEKPTHIFYGAQRYKKSDCVFVDGYWKPSIWSQIENENDIILQR